jgi:hypothetical protein
MSWISGSDPNLTRHLSMSVLNVAEILTLLSEERDPANTPVIYYGDAEKTEWPHLNFAHRSLNQNRFLYMRYRGPPSDCRQGLARDYYGSTSSAKTNGRATNPLKTARVPGSVMGFSVPKPCHSFDSQRPRRSVRVTRISTLTAISPVQARLGLARQLRSAHNIMNTKCKQ